MLTGWDLSHIYVWSIRPIGHVTVNPKLSYTGLGSKGCDLYIFLPLGNVNINGFVLGRPASHRTTHEGLRDMIGVLERNIKSQNALTSVPGEVSINLHRNKSYMLQYVLVVLIHKFKPHMSKYSTTRLRGFSKYGCWITSLQMCASFTLVYDTPSNITVCFPLPSVLV